MLNDSQNLEIQRTILHKKKKKKKIGRGAGREKKKNKEVAL